MVFNGVVEQVETDDTGCSWVDVAVVLSVDGKTLTECSARIALPAAEGDNPWKRKGEHWKP